MARRGLNNFVRKEVVRNGQPTWTLTTIAGDPVPAFDYFCSKNTDYSYQTQKRYAEVASRFIDYLYEAKVFDQAVRPGHLNDVIEAFPTLLRDGSALTASLVRKSGSDLWLAEAAERLDWQPLAPKSFDNTLAAVNRFLQLSESLAREANEKAELLGIETGQGYVALIKALDGTTTLSRNEVHAMKQNSMFGNVAKFAPKGIKRARGLRSPSPISPNSTRELDFPRDSLPALIHAADSWRDKTLWQWPRIIVPVTGHRLLDRTLIYTAVTRAQRQVLLVGDEAAAKAAVEGLPRDRSRQVALDLHLAQEVLNGRPSTAVSSTASVDGRKACSVALRSPRSQES